MTITDAPQRPLSTAEYHAMAEAGILDEDDRVELIDGRLIVMEPIGWPHANTVTILNRLLVERTPYLVSPQNPLWLSDYTEPQPDLVLLRPERDPDGPMLGPHALLVVEVADTSLAYDREIKLKRYALAEVPMAWIVDVNKRIVDVYSLPEGDTYAIRETPSTLALPGGGTIQVTEVFRGAGGG